jgi:hypothetical protein
MIGDFLIGKLAARIDIDAHPKLFTFRRKEFSVQLVPCIYVSSGTSPIVLAVGETNNPPDSIRIDFFEPTNKIGQRFTPFYGFVAFLRYGIYKLISKKVMVRPIMIFHGMNEFDDLFHGYQQEIFQLAAGDAGASKVLFD